METAASSQTEQTVRNRKSTFDETFFALEKHENK